MTVVVQRMEPERLFSFTWHPYAIDPASDYSLEPQTLVEFTLRPIPQGTLLNFDRPDAGLDYVPRRLISFSTDSSRNPSASWRVR